MKILILGAGQVGHSVAASLVHEDNDVTIVDTNATALRDLREKLDVRVEVGQASYPRVLERAGIEDADMLVAVTNSDEINMMACQIAHTLYHTPTKIARIRSSHYLDRPELFNDTAVPIDVLISPEQLVTEHIFNLISHPGSLQVISFANGKVQMVGVKALHDGPLIGSPLKAMREHMPGVEARVAAIFRKGKPIVPKEETVVEVNDEIFFIASPKHIRAIISELRKLDKPYKRIMLAGGGNIGNRLARLLEESRYHVKIIEKNNDRAAKLAERLDKTIVLEGDAADESLLAEENIDNTDVFVAITNDDEANILSSMLAKRLGARRVMCLINRPSYIDLVESSIDLAISPQQVTIGALLTHIRRGDIVAVHALRRGSAEAIEVVVHGNYKTSRVVGRRLDEIKLPPSTTIGALVRQETILMAAADLLVQENDHIIMLVTDKRYVPAVEKLFQVGIHFF
ncbi:MAG: Trk system potassium transporter TrkA [Candidatus Thiothrix putei]|jgi:K+ transport systems, NAD-binding component|uniref:Trk system potassium uptake protein TrkA n=2 Tax=Thiothrix TaxID=1030 RepID=A0A1H4FJF6_9GAMM|nr:Trk system potassium transporter TrkA [Thiothrix caldifontis]WGZ94516.1 MAG: Trk system potassium transporter TrkA [Candidatus Thiothrix putei]SEA97187.1 trk system potassium uptake protein TrkA [Thiothrix caldifontis]